MITKDFSTRVAVSHRKPSTKVNDKPLRAMIKNAQMILLIFSICRKTVCVFQGQINKVHKLDQRV